MAGGIVIAGLLLSPVALAVAMVLFARSQRRAMAAEQSWRRACAAGDDPVERLRRAGAL